MHFWLWKRYRICVIGPFLYPLLLTFPSAAAILSIFSILIPSLFRTPLLSKFNSLCPRIKSPRAFLTSIDFVLSKMTSMSEKNSVQTFPMINFSPQPTFADAICIWSNKLSQDGRVPEDHFVYLNHPVNATNLHFLHYPRYDCLLTKIQLLAF